MTEAEKLLKMIEELDLTNKFACDEVNARAWCFFNTHIFVCVDLGRTFNSSNVDKIVRFKYNNIKDSRLWHSSDYLKTYTNSLDAIKSIQESELNGWGMSIMQNTDDSYIAVMGGLNCPIIAGRNLPTEHLARLSYAL